MLLIVVTFGNVQHESIFRHLSAKQMKQNEERCVRFLSFHPFPSYVERIFLCMQLQPVEFVSHSLRSRIGTHIDTIVFYALERWKKKEHTKEINTQCETPNTQMHEWKLYLILFSFMQKVAWKGEAKKGMMKRNWKNGSYGIGCFFTCEFATSPYCCEIMSEHAQDIFRLI